MSELPEIFYTALKTKWGIDKDTADAFDLRANTQEMIHKLGLPYHDPEGNLVGIKWRYNDMDGQRKFFMEKLDGFRLWPFNVDRLLSGPTLNDFPVIITEGETDCMRLAQELTDPLEGRFYALGIPGLNKWEDEWNVLFKDRKKVYIVLDNDEARKASIDYDKKDELQKVDTAIQAAAVMKVKIRKTLGDKVRFVQLPPGVKDICEYFQMGYSGDEFLKLLDEADGREKLRIEKKKETLDTTPKPDQLSHFLNGKGFIQMVVDAFSPTTEAPDEYLVGGALQMISSAVGNHLTMPLGHQKIGMHMYTLLVGESGLARKSSAMNIAARIINECEAAAVMGSGFSPEGLEAFLKDHPNTFMVLDEFGRLAQTASKGYGVDIPHLLTELYGGWAHPRVLKPKEGAEAPKPKPFRVSLNVLAASTYSWLDGLSRADIQSGYLARFLILFHGKSEKCLPMPPDVSEEKKKEILMWMNRFKTDCQGEARLSEEAINDVLTPWYKGWKERIEGDPLGDVIGPFWARYDILSRKLAVLLELSDEPRPNPVVSADSLRRAQAAVDGVLEVLEHKLRNGLFGEADQVAVSRVLRHLQIQDHAHLVDLASVMDLPLYQARSILDAMIETGQIIKFQFNGHGTVYALAEAY